MSMLLIRYYFGTNLLLNQITSHLYCKFYTLRRPFLIFYGIDLHKGCSETANSRSGTVLKPRLTYGHAVIQYEMSNPNFGNKRKLGLIAGILVMGLVAASIAGGQALSAAAQQNSERPLPVDVGCPTGAEICEPEIEDVVQSIVSTSGTATVKVGPDKVSVTIGVETKGTTAAEAAAANAELMKKVLAALKDLGITDDQISTNWYSVYPVYSSIEPVNVCRVMEGYPVPPECYVNQEITGYIASNSVTVTLDAGEDVGKVIDEVVAAGATNVNGAYFFVSAERQEEIRSSLIEDAIDNARGRADTAAAAVDMEITGVKSINLNDIYFPVFYKDFAVVEGASSTPILPGQQEVSMMVHVTFVMS